MKRKIVCLFLIFSILFSIPVFSNATDYNENTLDLSDGSIKMSNAASNSSMTVTDYSSTMVVQDIIFNGTQYNQIYNTNPNYYKSGFTKNVITSNNFTVKANHTYSVNFKTRMDSSIRYSLRCYIYVYDGNGNAIDTIILYDFTSNGLSQTNEHTFDFNLSRSQLPAGYSLKFGITQTVPQEFSYQWKWSITDVSYTDNDDNTGLLNTIISAIGVVWNSIKDTASDMRTGFSNLGTTISNKFSELVTKISNSFDNLNQWLIDLKNSLTDKLTDVKNSITDKLTELKNYLLYFQADGKPTYNNPFSSALDNVISNINNWISQIQNFVDNINLSNQNVSNYISIFTNSFNRFSAAVPIFMTVISFGFTFIVIKKVVGR